jgi:hypothetical protein
LVVLGGDGDRALLGGVTAPGGAISALLELVGQTPGIIQQLPSSFGRRTRL